MAQPSAPPPQGVPVGNYTIKLQFTVSGRNASGFNVAVMGDADLPHPHVAIEKFTAEIRYSVRRIESGDFMAAEMDRNASWGGELHRSCLRQTGSWYNVHDGFNKIEGSNTLEAVIFDKENSIAIVERIDYDLNGWLSRQYRKPGQGRQQLLSYWTSSQDSYRWWNAIKSEFLMVFGPCIRGLRAIHKKGKFHGQIRDGIVMRRTDSEDGPIKAMLYNMVNPIAGTDIREAQKRDIEDMRDLILRVVNYPFVINYPLNQEGRSFTVPANPPEIDHLCLSHLNLIDRFDNPHLQLTPLQLDWILNPVIFWSHFEVIRLLEAMHRMMYICRCNRSSDFLMNAESNFIDKTWANRVTPPIACQGLMDVRDEYKKHDPPGDDPYVAGPYVGMQKLLFWYNCIEYGSYRLLPDCQEDRHLAIIEVVPNLLPEVVATVCDLLSSNANENLVKVLFQNMGWKC